MIDAENNFSFFDFVNMTLASCQQCLNEENCECSFVEDAPDGCDDDDGSDGGGE